MQLYTSGVSYAPYMYGTIICTIRVWLYHMRMVQYTIRDILVRIRVWYVPYAYGMYHTRMVQNMCSSVKGNLN